MSMRNRSAFTMVELLMVIVIIGLLMALLFPALGRFRETARQTECLTRMKNVATAIDIVAEKENAYPGWRNPRLRSDGPYVSWVLPLLPNLERKDVYDHWRNTPGTPDAPKIELLICPTDTAKSGRNQTGPAISFVGNSGRPDRDPTSPTTTRDIRSNGIFMDLVSDPSNRQTPSFIVKADGKANTLLLSENLDATRWNVTGEDQNCMVWHPTENAIRKINGTGSGGDAMDRARPSSQHLDGVNIIMASNAGRFLNDDIDYNVYQSMMTVRDQSWEP